MSVIPRYAMLLVIMLALDVCDVEPDQAHFHKY